MVKKIKNFGGANAPKDACGSAIAFVVEREREREREREIEFVEMDGGGCLIFRILTVRH